jgi:hypothetical protein
LRFDWGEVLYPNNVELHEHDGRTYLLVTYKGSDRAVSGNSELGRIMLWDVSDPAAPAQVWAYPPAGYLAASHGGVIRTVYGQEVLLYAHAYGASGDLDAPDDGSVGLALMSWDAPPTYLGDLVLPSTDPSPLGFVRAVDVLDPGPTDGGATGTDRATLLVTDSGCENQEGECNRPVGILEVALDPLPEPPGVTGAFSGDHADQRMIEVREATDPYRDSLKFPFQALPIPEAELAGVLTDGPGACP